MLLLYQRIKEHLKLTRKSSSSVISDIFHHLLVNHRNYGFKLLLRNCCRHRCGDRSASSGTFFPWLMLTIPCTGRSTALKFAETYPVVLLARRPESYEQVAVDIKKAGGEAIGITADVADPASLAKAFDTIGQQLPGKKLAVALFNVNGGFAKKPFLELKPEELDSSLDGTM